jgi:membrane associated rhomboid family serine protease
MPTWDETTPYTERSTFSRHASVTNAFMGVHLVALTVAAVFHLVQSRAATPFIEACNFQTIPALYGLQAWRFITFPFAHPLDPASLAVFVLLGWLFLRAGNELEREWGGARMFGFCTAMALYGATAHAVYEILSGASGPLIQGIGGFHAPVLGVLLMGALRSPRRPVLFFMLVPMRAITLFWLVFGVALIYGVFLTPTSANGIPHGPSPVAMAGAAAAAWAYARLDPRLDRFLEWLDTRRSRAKFLEEFELRAQMDLLLDKIQKSGMDSLTRQERNTLRRASGLYKPPERPGHE